MGLGVEEQDHQDLPQFFRSAYLLWGVSGTSDNARNVNPLGVLATLLLGLGVDEQDH
jgi:hypothetical protein